MNLISSDKIPDIYSEIVKKFTAQQPYNKNNKLTIPRK